MNVHAYASRGDNEGLRRELANGAPVDARDERDYTPLACALSSPDATAETTRLLIDAGADVNATVGDPPKHVLGLAAGSGDQEIVRLLLEAGADIRYVLPAGYTVLINVAYSLHDSEQLVPMIDFLIEHGAEMNSETTYGESPLRVASYQGRFDAVRRLLDAGADPTPLQWNELMRAIALGDAREVQTLLDAGADLKGRDSYDRTPWLLSVHVGDIEKARLLHAAGANVNEGGRCGRTALMFCVERNDAAMLRWLISVGADIERTDDFGSTPLTTAAQAGAAECVQVLLDAGADIRRKGAYDDSAIANASNLETVRVLVDAGEDIDEISTEMKRQLTGLGERTEELDVSKKQYLLGKHRRFGRANPEVMDVPFWREMVRAGCSAWRARAVFEGGRVADDGPVWCFDRFGMSFTQLPDGRFVQIGGEHEDFYDPDFCIYNEIFVHHGPGEFQILGYPKEVFPPTDFHSATYVDGYIYIIGGLGYAGSRQFGVTPVYRLDCETWRIERLESSGENPGWIYDHKARPAEPRLIEVTRGTMCQERAREEEHIANEERFVLDLREMTWWRSP